MTLDNLRPDPFAYPDKQIRIVREVGYFYGVDVVRSSDLPPPLPDDADNA